jgi:hypothetical protein
VDSYVTTAKYRRVHPFWHRAQKTFYFFFAINICLAAFVWFFIPETRRVSLEEIDTLFGGSNHLEKGADLLHIEDAHHASVDVANTDAIVLTDKKNLDVGQ